jgi:2OG-Fe(II) oxygenase superfamily
MEVLKARPTTTDIQSEFHKTGTIMLPAGSLFTNIELDELQVACQQVPEETIVLGDAGEPNDLYVGRFMVDKPGELPTLVNRPVSDGVINLLGQPKRREFFKSLLGSDQHIRRCQVNRMVRGSFIGRHLDTDSNPDYCVSIVIQLGQTFAGGEFVVYPEEAPTNSFEPTLGTVIVSDCRLPHEVRRVRGGERVSLVYFLSELRMENRRTLLAAN